MRALSSAKDMLSIDITAVVVGVFSYVWSCVGAGGGPCLRTVDGGLFGKKSKEQLMLLLADDFAPVLGELGLRGR